MLQSSKYRYTFKNKFRYEKSEWRVTDNSKLYFDRRLSHEKRQTDKEIINKRYVFIKKKSESNGQTTLECSN